MDVTLYQRPDYKSLYKVRLIDGNIILKNKDESLPKLEGEDYINFTSDFSPVYRIHSIDKANVVVNTRIRCVKNGNIIKSVDYFYCNLNCIQRVQLKYIEKRLTLQTNPFYFWASISALVVSVISLIVSALKC